MPMVMHRNSDKNSTHNMNYQKQSQSSLFPQKLRSIRSLVSLSLITASLLTTGFINSARPQTPLSPEVKRTPLVPRTLVFSRTQSQYNLYFNYFHYHTPEWYWIDRPLFFDKSLAPEDYPGSELTERSFSRVLETARAYELDGFSMMANLTTNRRNYLQALDLAGKKSDEPFSILLDVSALGSDVDKAVNHIKPALEKALTTPSAPRVNNKVLISSYNLDSDSPQVVAQVLAKLRQQYGDTFVLVAAIGRDWWPAYNDQVAGVNPNKNLAALQAKLRSWLDVCDGIMYVMLGDASNPENGGHLEQGYYNFVIQTCLGVLGEPAYRQKYFGLGASTGYFNPITNSVANEAGTKYLRNSLRIALDAKPDFIILPEWDEANENTSIQPTVYNSLSTQRLIRHEMRRLKNQPQTPQAGDNVSIPNLVVSYRQFLMQGEALQVEVLNVPDGSVQGDYRLKLSFKDDKHRVVKTLPVATLGNGALQDHTFTVPTEELADYPVLMPSLEVTSPNGKTQTFEAGLAAIRLQPTMNWNRKWVKMPLRDLLRPTSTEFRLVQNSATPAGKLKVEGKVATNERIMSVEVVADGLEVFALDPEKTYDLKPDEALILMHEVAPARHGDFNGKYFVTGGTVRKVVDQFGFWRARQPGEVSVNLTWSPLGQIFVVTNKDTAVIHAENNLYKTAVPVSRILKDKVYSEVHGRGATVTMRAFEGVPETPRPLLSKDASFQTTIDPIRPGAALQMRVITESGKIYRSWPVVSPVAPTGKVALPVYSDTKHEAVTVQVDSSRLPQITATPAQTSGASIQASTDPYFTGMTGGIPFWSYIGRKNGSYPATATQTAPTRVTEDGIYSWRFDGQGNFLYFPAETLPRGAFTLSFKFKPLSNKRQILLANRNHLTGAFTLEMENGKLSGYYIPGLARQEPYYPKTLLQPDIAVPLEQWSQVEIAYDLKQIVFKVNGKAAKAIPLTLRGRISTPLVFGGYGDGKQDGFFDGYLQELKIVHGVAAS